MPSVDLSGFRLLRVEHDPYERETEEDEEYDFDYEPDPVEVLIRVRAALRCIVMDVVLRSAAHRGWRPPPRRQSTSRSSVRRESKLEERCSGLSTATTLSSRARTSSPCLTTTRVRCDFLSLSELRHLTSVQYLPPTAGELSDFAATLFDGRGQIKNHVAREGKGVWGRELNAATTVAYLQELRVEKEFRSKGIGRWALSEILKHTDEHLDVSYSDWLCLDVRLRLTSRRNRSSATGRPIHLHFPVCDQLGVASVNLVERTRPVCRGEGRRDRAPRRLLPSRELPFAPLQGRAPSAEVYHRF